MSTSLLATDDPASPFAICHLPSAVCRVWLSANGYSRRGRIPRRATVLKSEISDLRRYWLLAGEGAVFACSHQHSSTPALQHSVSGVQRRSTAVNGGQRRSTAPK